MGTCICYRLPPKGEFVVGKEYPWTWVIDGLIVKDENGMGIDFRNEIFFLIYFKK